MNARDIIAKARATNPDTGEYYGHDRVDEACADAYIAALRAAAGGDVVVILPDDTVGRLVQPTSEGISGTSAPVWGDTQEGRSRQPCARIHALAGVCAPPSAVHGGATRGDPVSTDDEPTDGVLANEFTGIVYSRGPSPIPALSVAEKDRLVAAARQQAFTEAIAIVWAETRIDGSGSVQAAAHRIVAALTAIALQ